MSCDQALDKFSEKPNSRLLVHEEHGFQNWAHCAPCHRSSKKPGLDRDMPNDESHIIMIVDESTGTPDFQQKKDVEEKIRSQQNGSQFCHKDLNSHGLQCQPQHG